jgi:hypothetical protein
MARLLSLTLILTPCLAAQPGDGKPPDICKNKLTGLTEQK